MARHGPQFKYPRVHVGLCLWDGDGERQIIVLGNIRILGAVPVLVPGCDDIVGLKDEKHEHEIFRCHGFAVRPAGIGIQFGVNRFALGIHCPGFGQRGVEFEFIRVSMGQPQAGVVEDPGAKRAVRIGPSGA